MKIYLTLLNATGYVFSADDYMEIRTKHRIMGALVGTTNNKGWSSSEAALPVELTKWETQLLIEKEIAVLVSKSADLSARPTSEMLGDYKSKFETHLLAQSNALKAEKLRETERHVQKILAGKRNKLVKKGKADEAAALTSETVLQEVANNFVFERQNALVELPFCHMTDHCAQLCTAPVYDTNSLKFRVFRDMWQRGKFISSGEAFGADFLIYPGDPLLYHASHLVIIQDSPAVRPLELIGKVRLSVIVNKACVLAYEETDGQIVYQTVNWWNPSK